MKKRTWKKIDRSSGLRRGDLIALAGWDPDGGPRAALGLVLEVYRNELEVLIEDQSLACPYAFEAVEFRQDGDLVPLAVAAFAAPAGHKAEAVRLVLAAREANAAVRDPAITEKVDEAVAELWARPGYADDLDTMEATT